MADLKNCLNLASPELRAVYDYEFKKWESKNPNGSNEDFINFFEKTQLDKKAKELLNFQENQLKIERLDEQFKQGNEYLKSINKPEISKYEFLHNLLVDRIKITEGQNQGLFFKLNRAQANISADIQKELERIGNKYNFDLVSGLRRENEANIKIDNDVIIERAILNGATDVEDTGNQMAKDIAKMLNDLSLREIDLMKKSGLDIGLLDGYAGKQTHNAFTLYDVGFEK